MINNKRVKVYQLWHESKEPIPYNYSECMEKVRNLSWIDDYNLIEFKSEEDLHKTVIKTDDIRLDIACNDPWALIVCADLVITKKLEFSGEGYPYFGERKFMQPHLSLIYVNNCCDWFKKLDRNNRPRVYGWTDKLFKGKTYYAIPSESYVHYWITKKSELKGMNRKVI